MKQLELGVSEEARRVHAASPVIDLHCDLLLTTRFLGWQWGRRHAPNRLPGAPLFGHVDLPRLREGNVCAMALGIVVDPLAPRRAPLAVAANLARMRAEIARAPEELAFAGDAEAVRAARGQGRIAVFGALEGAHGLGGRIEELGWMREAGLRAVGFAHFTANPACRPQVGWGASNTAPLSPWGHALVEACDYFGLVVDLAHVGRRAALDACGRATRPVMVSHTGCAAVHASVRAVDDDVLRAVARTDGVVGTMFVSPIIGAGGAAQVARHLDHIRATVGVRHAAVGTDWEGFATYPADLRSADQLVNLTEALLRIGWSDEEIRAVYAENFLRVYEGAGER